jgi:putative NADH-flavin reductase
MIARMNLLVFGATGRVGRAFVTQALAANHAVTAVVRDAKAALPGSVTLAAFDVLDPNVASIVKRDHVIVGTLGGADALTKGYANVVLGATKAGATRMIALVGAGVLQADETTLRNQLPSYPERLRAIGATHAAAYETLRTSSALEWTLVCVPNIVDGPVTGTAKSKASYLPDGKGAITTGDIAAFMLEEITTPRFVRQRVGLNS